jgi:hypothetical protein
MEQDERALACSAFVSDCAVKKTGERAPFTGDQAGLRSVGDVQGLFGVMYRTKKVQEN